MKGMMTVREAARRWNLTERRVSGLCREGKIEGAEKQGRFWMIPADAGRPADNRVKSGIYKKKSREAFLPLPVGVSDYRLASTEYYYVDKTLMIRDFIDERPMVSLFTRPRRFGKTLNMDMLRTFFEKGEEDNSIYFRDKKIWSCGRKYQEYQGRYPVIFITFKDVKKDTWAETYDSIAQVIILEFKRHRELADSSRVSDTDYYQKVIGGGATRNDMENSMGMLTKMLHDHHGVAPILIIDEYDIPIQQGYMRGFYDNVILFMRNLFSSGLKDNRHLSFGFLTGILRVSKESIFSGLNNLKINSVLDHKYSSYFGFTPDEVREMAEYYGAAGKYEEICEWYDGYRFGRSDIFNPWSVVNYFSSGCEPRAFWQYTGSNDIIGDVIGQADREIYDRLTSLVKGETFTTYIDTGVIYPQIKNNPSTIYSFLLVAGYLKAVRTSLSITGDFMCEVALPNKELSFVYKKEVLRKLDRMIPQSTTIAIQEAVYSGDALRLRELIQTLLLQAVSFHDTWGENFYHGFMLGICALFDGSYVSSNRESGEGRYDIRLMPKDGRLPGILIELKAGRDENEDQLKHLSQAALQQILDKQYDTEMTAMGVRTIYHYGVAFSGKHVEVVVR